MLVCVMSIHTSACEYNAFLSFDFFFFFFLVALGLCCCAQSFSSCGLRASPLQGLLLFQGTGSKVHRLQ